MKRGTASKMYCLKNLAEAHLQLGAARINWPESDDADFKDDLHRLEQRIVQKVMWELRADHR